MPSSGSSPYTFTADIANVGSFNYGWSLEFIAIGADAVCPVPPTTGASMQEAVNSLIASGEWVWEGPGSNVANGSCRAINLIVRNSAGAIVDQSNVFISRV